MANMLLMLTLPASGCLCDVRAVLAFAFASALISAAFALALAFIVFGLALKQTLWSKICSSLCVNCFPSRL
jgi:hypothetical protein